MNNFNDQQLKAINSSAPTILCIASPGSGKSSTLVARVQRLLRDGVDPASICVVTFTNHAACELQSRLNTHIRTFDENGDSWIGVDVQQTRLGHCGTLHGICFRLLQQHGHLIGLPPQLTILDEEAAAELFEECCINLKAKGNKDLLKQLRETYFMWGPMQKNWSVDHLVIKEYYSRLRDSGAVDFNCILHQGLQVIKLLAQGTSWPFKYLFVDEFQDACNIDSEIYDWMPCSNKFMVGDPDQGIYKFRGSNVHNIIDLAYKESTELIRLEENYRSGETICDVANRLISYNADRVPKQIVATRGGGEVTVRHHQLPDQELEFIVREIRGQLADQTAASIAVIWRTNALADKCREYLVGHGIAVKERRPVRAAATASARAALAVMMNPWNEMALTRLLTAVEGKERVQKMKRDCDMMMITMTTLVLGETAMVLQKDSSIMQDYNWNELSANVMLLLSRIGLDAETVAVLRTAADKLVYFTLADLIFALNEQPEAETGTGVTVCTAHAAKGREWDLVIIGGCEQETWLRKNDDDEECRRLFFVAVTRARDRLLLTSAAKRPCSFKQWVMEDKSVCQFVQECLPKTPPQTDDLTSVKLADRKTK